MNIKLYGGTQDETGEIYGQEILSTTMSDGQLTVNFLDLVKWYNELKENLPDGLTEESIVLNIQVD